MFMAFLACCAATAQSPLADLPNLIPNGGFEEGTNGWRVSIGPREWEAAKGIAEVLDRDADAGQRCLRLNAREQDNEVDVLSDVLTVEPNAAYLLLARVKQFGGEGGYKVTIDWRDADGKHLSYSNDWTGNDHPTGFADHGGVFTAPEGAAQAGIIMGVSKGAECLFDEVRLSPLPAAPGEDVPDGSGSVEAEVPATIQAGGYGTFRFTYHAGEQGLPVGGAVYLRRDNIDPRWSPPQTSDPKGPGYLTAKASNGALCMVQPGGALTVPSVTRIALVYPPLKPDDTLTITYGDTSGGSPGAQAQTKAEQGLHFVLSVDGDRDDRPLDLPDTPAFDVLSGPLAHTTFTIPPVVVAGVPFTVTGWAEDANDNLALAARGEIAVCELRGDQEGPTHTAPFQGGRAQVQLGLAESGIRRVRAQGPRSGLVAMVHVSRPPARPAAPPEPGAHAFEDQGTYILANPYVRLLLPVNDFGYGVGFLEARAGEAWKRLGLLPWATEIEASGTADTDALSPTWLPEIAVENAPQLARVTLRGAKASGGTQWDVAVEFSLRAGARQIDCRCSATPRADAHLSSFSGPPLLVGEGSFGRRKDSALFPGVEYLTADEESSGDYGIVPPYSERHAPNPLKLTIPLMAVAADGMCAALFWDPLQPWTRDQKRPTAHFGSPPLSRGGALDAHYLSLVAPPTPDGLLEITTAAEESITVDPGQTLTLTASLVALAPASDVTDVVRYWFEVNGVPDPPPMPRSWEQADELTVRGFLETAWDAEKLGWHNALNDPWGAAYNDQMALRLWHYAKTHPGSPLTPRIEAELKEAFDAAGGMRGYDFAFHTGNPVQAWEAERAAGLRDALAMAPDGSYAYHPHTGNKMFTQAQAKSLGKDGEVNIGTCVMGLEPLMRRALITGDPFLLAQGEKGLAFIDRFTRPQGAENWEVPLACPNLRAAALATRCYLYGYLLTGKEHYLQKARFWATTGLPFIYMWNAEDRPIMRYTSISVMGTSLHTGTWFGKPVQWVGLVYADALTELAAHDDSFPWRKIAEGILTCAMQMQKTEADECKHVGFYPDGYNVVEGKEAYHWCLAPTLIADVSAALRGQNPRVSTTIVRTGDQRLHITSPGSVSDPAFEGNTLRFTATYLAGSEHEVLVSPVGSADEVLVDGSPLTSGEKTGWEVVPPGLLRIHVSHQAAAEAKIEVRGCRVTELPTTMSMGALTNGDFEQGLQGWAPSPPERAQESDGAHSGKRALLLDARGLNTEVQCPSAPLSVTEGKTYELVSWVKQLAGEGSYKVTIDWLGVAGHISYDNDWQGTDKPAAYTQHGGRFTAPPGAKAAVIILGVQPGTACLFDDVAVQERGRP